MSRWLAFLFAFAATTALLFLLVPHGQDVNDRLAALTGLAAYPVVALLYFGADRVPRWAIHALLLFGTLMIGFGIHTGTGRTAGAASAWYYWIGVYAGYFFARPAIVAHLAAVAVSYAVVLELAHEPAGPALVGGMTLAVAATAFVMSTLAGRLRSLASTDPLTGLPNRRGWEEALDRELARVRRRGTPLCVAVLDLDSFKAFNDDNGHLAGDRLLKEVAATWLGLLRDSDVLARYGGDEFGIILPDCYPNKAREIIGRLCSATSPGSSCSAGVAEAQAAMNMSQLIDCADRALYRAKAAGGSQAVFAGHPETGAGAGSAST
ncbi:MAG: diguanylate cyclase [Actinomycetota bacterium]|jgi:diguanylate cyclase (GGDEF)-like protein